MQPSAVGRYAVEVPKKRWR